MDTEITATRRLGSVERPEYIPLASPNHPLLRVVAGCPFLPCSGILLAGRVAVNPAGALQNSTLFNRENHLIQHGACLHALNSVEQIMCQACRNVKFAVTFCDVMWIPWAANIA